ncbi:MAG: hypothetical protein RBT34_11010 [Anaerolineaceae bacterium]|jgi:hypothetical protein|nr:hypothetical protein [Anaerolineaceae bacterium]
MTVENKQARSKQGFWQRAWPYLTIVLVTLIAHGFLLLMDWTFWEGAFNYPIIVSRDAAQMNIWTEQAIPIFIPFLLMLGAFANAFWASHFIAFLSFLAIGLLVYEICQTSKLMRRGESLWIALLTVLYPVFQMAVVNTVVAYIFGYALFLAGVLLALRMESAVGWRRWTQRGLALLLLLAGLNFLQSLYVFYFGFLLFYLFFLLKREGLGLGEGVKKLAPRRLDLILLPFIAWGIRALFYPSAGYNSFKFDPQIILKWTVSFFNFGFWDPLSTLLTRHWWLTLLVFVVCAAFLYYLPKKLLRIAEEFDERPAHWLWLALSVMLFVMGFFAYVLVNKGLIRSVFADLPSDTDTRNTLLLGLPVAIFITAIARWLVLRRRPVVMALGASLLVVFAAESALTHVQNYADWQIRAVKDRSFIAQLAKMDEVQPYPVLWVHDEFPAGGIQFVEGRGVYAGEELQLIAHFAWPGGTPHSLIHNDYRKLSEQDFADRNLRYLAPGAGLENCQAELILRRNPEAGSDLNVLAHYYYYKFFRGEEVLTGYLTGNYRLTLVFFEPSKVQPVEGCP